jgi:glutamate-1-semialdehyde 2,1-aminomutase
MERQMAAASPNVDRLTLRSLLDAEATRFRRAHPRSEKLARDARKVLMAGVPMTWMTKWPGGFPVFFKEGNGNRITDVDGVTYIDVCLGDSAAIAGHGSRAVAEAQAERYRAGATAMLPTEDAIWVAKELRRRFSLDVWQFTGSATDANRWVLRMARQVTGRPRILVFNGCYHGTVDETVVQLDRAGRPRSRDGNVGPAVDPTTTTKVIEFNDVVALERALDAGDVACVLAEPVMTNVGMVQPDPGFHQSLRALTRDTGTWLILDETQTWAAGIGGCTRAMRLDPDVVTLGKGMAGGIAIGAFGMRKELADRVIAADVDLEDGGSVGGTLAGNALALASARAALGNVLTDAAFRKMVALGETFVQQLREQLNDRGLAWVVTAVGARAEYRFCATPPRNGSESSAAANEELDEYLHLALLNRGVLQTPFHNMVLFAPTATRSDVAAVLTALCDSIDRLTGH